MLADFKVRNYRNFRDELHFSLESRKNYEFNQKAVHNGIIKDSVIIGYNASGKTNLGSAVMDIIIHLTDRRVGETSSLIYSNLNNRDDTVAFSYKFKFGSSFLEYTYEKRDPWQVLRECMKIDGKKIIVNEEDIYFARLKGSETLKSLQKYLIP